MTTVIVIGLLIAVALIGLQVLWDWRRSGRLWCGPIPLPYRNRESQEGIWRERYGHDMLADIDALLTLLCNAFDFNPDDRFKFAPDDQVMDIYRGCYPRWAFWLVGDSMEIETMMTGLKDRFEIERGQWFAEITLGRFADSSRQSRMVDPND